MCKDLCHEVKSKAAKLDKYEDFYIDLVKCLFTKMAKNKSDEQSQINFILLVLEMFVSVLKNKVLDAKQMENVCQSLQDCVMLIDQNEGVSALIRKSTMWLSFIKMSLKYGIQPHQDTSGKLLDTLAKFCDIIYENDAEEPQIDKIFQWTHSHSEFLTVMLGKTEKRCKL